MKWNQLRPFRSSQGIEQLKSESGYEIELFKRRKMYGRDRGYEVRVMFPDGTAGWVYPGVAKGEWAVACDLTVPKYVIQRIARMWSDMESIMK